jgi:integrase
MRWTEVDFDRALWTIPASRMKARREHVAPLTEPALSVLRAAQGLHPELVFPSSQQPRGKPVGPMSDMSINVVMRRMHAGALKANLPGYVDARSKRAAVPHGLRSTFRDWAAETGFDHIMAEIALAHDVGSETERAYRRTGMVEARRGMMEAWGRVLRGEPNPVNVVSMAEARR